MEFKNANAPATKKQLWLLHILTKEDTRSWQLTIKEASDKITELKGNGKRPLVNPHATALQKDAQLKAQQQWDKQYKSDSLTDTKKIITEARQAGTIASQAKLKELQNTGPQWELYDADLAGNRTPRGKSYKILDLCGFAHLEIKNRHGKFWRDCLKMHEQGERIYAVKGYRGLSIFDMTNRQEISINEAAYRAAGDVLRKHGIDCYMQSRLD